jgi:NTE family protein
MKLLFSSVVILFLAGCASIAPPALVIEDTIPVETPVVRVPPRIGLALGGGAARGFAHIGVIQVLEEADIRPALVTGTSAGSLVAAIYASGKTGTQLQQVAEAMEEATMADWTLPLFSRGMLKGEALARYVNTQVRFKAIEDALAIGHCCNGLKQWPERDFSAWQYWYCSSGVKCSACGFPTSANCGA